MQTILREIDSEQMDNQNAHKTKPRSIRQFANSLALLSLGAASLTYTKVKSAKWNTRLLLYGMKLLTGALAPLIAAQGVISAILGSAVRAPVAIISGVISTLLATHYVRNVTASHNGFERAFGPEWQNKITHKPRHWLQRRWMWVQVPRQSETRITKDLAFWVLPDTDQPLLCDLWQPAPGTTSSGLTVVYMHGGAWQSFDKDVGTRPFFRYLTAQGHTVMDVAYRLCHETDMYGMVGDVKRAIAWLKIHADRYHIDPERIILVGGSAGGHLALLAGYTPNHPKLDPPDVQDIDTSVRAVISYYGLPDLRKLHLHGGQPPGPALLALGKQLGFVAPKGYFSNEELAQMLFGGPPRDVQDVAALMSPITHVGSHCPPTLLLQGAHDHITPVADVHKLRDALTAIEVPVVYVEFPYVEHAFDMFVLQTSPAAQAALYDVERFLALML